MSNGFLIVEVYDNNIKAPLESAVVQILGENTDIIVQTNENGKTESITLAAPDIKYSLEPQKDVRPYSIYSLKISKPGYKTFIIEGVEVFPSETSLQKVFLEKGQDIEYEELPPHVLWGNYPQKIDEDILLNNNVRNRVYPEVFIPEYIIVHDGVPSNSSARNYIVSFPDYIKNVASSEIYSTWPLETIKANVLAIISFTLNRVFTEWYPSRGYNFTITSSTAYDQKYTQGRTIFLPISEVVDDIFNNYLSLTDSQVPFFAQYNDGVKTNNKGWLSQWGSKSLGDQGYSALRIVRYYYDPNMTIKKANDIIGLPLSFPGFNLSKGSCGEYVQKIQNELNRISNNYPAIPKIIPANGQYNDSTKKSVEKFQQVFNLPITGIINFATWYKISYIYVAVSKMIN
ncbi:MAG: peptidoglycan-binding protein [Bacilli bacterium]|nr:peptidoglycan-binding protein [Bacilli bacterium]